MSMKFIINAGIPQPGLFSSGDGSPLVLDSLTGKIYYMDGVGAVVQILDSSYSVVAHTHLLTAVTDVSLTVANLNSLGNGGDSSLHFHTTDRARANHTGTQGAGTITGLAAVATSGAYASLTGLPTLGTASPLNVAVAGNAATGEVVKGSDTRLSDSRAPLAHTQTLSTISDVTITATNLNILDDGVDTTLHFHAADRARANHTGTQAVGTITGLAVVATSGAYADLSGLPALGTASPLNVPAAGDAATGEVVKGSDTRLTNSRSPTAHTQALSTINDVTITAANLNILDDGLDTALHFHAADRARATHTGTQAAGTITGLATVATSGAYADLSGLPTLGTSSPLNVAAAGDAAAGEVVKGSDTRLTNARTPTAHTQALSTISDVTITATNLNILDDGLDTTLHFHAADRARANHTGTQTWATLTATPITLAGYAIGDAAPLSHVGAGGTAHANVVAAGAAGFMTGADKTLLDALSLPRSVLVERRSTNYTNSTVTATNVFTGITTVANGVYLISGIITTQCSGVGGNKFSIVAPTGAVVEGWAKGVLATLAAPSYQRITAINTLTAIAMNTAATIPAPLSIDAIVVCGATTGTLTVGAAVVTAAQINTVFANSVLTITRIA